MNINIPCKNFLSLLLIIQMQLAAMDLPYPQLQLSKLDKKPVLHGKLMIDHLAKKDVHTYTIFNPVEYLTQDIRETYSYGNRFSTIPLDMPFVHIIIKTEKLVRPEIFTIIPAEKLAHLSTGSKINFETDRLVFHLTCVKNPQLIIKSKYFPKDIFDPHYFPTDKTRDTFQTQFLGCMNKFYAKIPHYPKHPCTEKLVQHNILLEYVDRMPLVIDPTFEMGIKKYTYSHGPHGCASPEKLVKLAANPKTGNHNYSMFNHVVNRQQSSKHVPKPKQTNPAENGRLKCYYSYLENVKTVGNKSPMPKTMHAYKSPALDIDNSNPVVAEETPDQALLDNILEDCLVEFDIKEKTEKAALDNIIENCLTSLTAEESKAAATNNLHSQLKDGLIAQRGSEYGHHEHCVLF